MSLADRLTEARERKRAAAHDVAARAAARGAVGKIAELLQRSGIDPDDIGRVQRINAWQGFYKDAEGEAHTQDMIGVQLSPSWETGPEWPVVEPAKPRPPRVTKTRRRKGRVRRALIVPDEQIGYRRELENLAELDPFHDESAMAVALAVARELDPDEVVFLGDGLDFPEWGKYEQEPGFVQTTQPTLDRAHEWHAQMREAAPNARHRRLEGNHDRRLQNAVVNNAKAAFGLRQAATPPESWPVLSVPHLLRLDELGVEYVDAYPAGQVWLNDRLRCEHGWNLNATKTLAEEQVSVIHGHVHRRFLLTKRRPLREGGQTVVVASPGCLCRIDGTVPSTRGSYNSKGRAARREEDWQQGVAVVEYVEGDGPFRIDVVPIEDGAALFAGQLIAA